MHKYELIIYWSNEDKVYIAEAPELPGCSAPDPDFCVGARLFRHGVPVHQGWLKKCVN